MLSLNESKAAERTDTKSNLFALRAAVTTFDNFNLSLLGPGSVWQEARRKAFILRVEGGTG